MGWVTAKGHCIEPYGLDFSAELIELARQRLPHWQDRLFIGTINEATTAGQDSSGPPSTEAMVTSWGFKVSGRTERPHFREPNLAYRVLWIDSR